MQGEKVDNLKIYDFFDNFIFLFPTLFYSQTKNITSLPI